MSAYRQMGYSPSTLENPRRLLSGFNGATTTSQGDVVLPVQAGSVTLSMQFSVVDDLSPYNAIMGRAWLYKMKVIPSMYHQIVSYLMEEGQGQSPWQLASPVPMLPGGIRVRTSNQRGGTFGAIKRNRAITITKPNEERSIYD